jgi:hypothetical protein
MICVVGNLLKELYQNSKLVSRIQYVHHFVPPNQNSLHSKGLFQKINLPVRDDEVTVLREVRNTIQQNHHPANTITEKSVINHKEIALPLSWFWQEGSLKEQEFVCSKFKWLDENEFEYTKTVIINGNTCTLRYFIRGKQIYHEKLKYHFSTVNELTSFLKLYDDAQVCNDYPGLLNQVSNISKQSNRTPPRQEVANSRFDDTSLEVPSIPPKRTYSNMQQSQAASKIHNRNPGNNASENLVEPEVTSVLMDHAYGVATNLPAPLVQTSSEIIGKKSAIVNTSADHRQSANISQLEDFRGSQVIPESHHVGQIEDRDSVTLQYPIEFYTSSGSSLKELEQMLVKRPEFFQYSTYNLISYHLETWCLGVYSPFKPDMVSPSFIQFFNPHKVFTTPVERTPMIENYCVTSCQPSFLVEKPKQVYCRREVIPLCPTKEIRKLALKKTDIENRKIHNGKIHVTSNVESVTQLSLSNLFQDDNNYFDYQPIETNRPSELDKPTESSIPKTVGKRVRSSLFSDMESEVDDNDKKDLELARRFLEKEIRRRKTLRKKCQRYSTRVER